MFAISEELLTLVLEINGDIDLRHWFITSIAASFFTLGISPAFSQSSERIAISYDWSLFCDGQYCWAATFSEDDRSLLIMSSIGRGEPLWTSIGSDAGMLSGAEQVTLSVGGHPFSMIVDAGQAYLSDPKDEPRLLANFLASVDKGTEVRIGSARYPISLRGYTKMLFAAYERVGVKFRSQDILPFSNVSSGPLSLLEPGSITIAGQEDGTQNTGWAKSPITQAALKDLRASAISQATDLCASPRTVESADVRRKLLSRTALTTFNGEWFTRFVVTQDMIEHNSFCLHSGSNCTTQTAKLLYCASGEALFFIGTEPVVAVERLLTPEVALRMIHAPLFTVDSIDRPIENKDCSVRGGPPEATSASWSGGCSGGRPQGPGEMQWKNGDEVVWRTRVGEEWGVVLLDGSLFIDVDLSKFRFEIASCETDRLMTVYLPPNTPLGFLEINRIAAEILNTAANAAIQFCPNEKGFEGIRVIIRSSEPGTNDSVLLSAANVDRTLTWGEYNNPFYASLVDDLGKAEKERRKEIARRVEEAETARLLAEFEGRRDAIIAMANQFLDARTGSFEALVAALSVDELATLQIVEKGFSLQHPPVTNGVQVVEDRGERRYRISYVLENPFVRLEREILSARHGGLDSFQRLLQLAVSKTYRVTCDFGDLSDIPQTGGIVQATLKSFDSEGAVRSIQLDCE